MGNVFKICNECKTINVNTLLPRLKEIDPEAEIEIGCQSYCGIGHKKHFAVINGRYITAMSEDQLVERIRKYLGE